MTRFWLLLLLILTGSPALLAQHQGMHQGHSAMAPMTGMQGMYGLYPMARESSGTSWQPDSSQPGGTHVMYGGWNVMMMGFLNGSYTDQGSNTD